MTTRIHFKGAGYRSGGTLYSHDWRQVHVALARHGARELWDSTRPDFFVAGKRPGAKEAKARAQGVPILHEEDLDEAIKAGYFDYEERVIDPDLDLNTVISELRTAFDGVPTSRDWTRCLELIERCPEEQLEPVLHYIEQGTSGWKNHPTPWTPSHRHDLLTGVPKSWLKGCPEDELCVAPPLWLYEMTRKKYHPKHRLVRALNLSEMRMNLHSYRSVLENPHMQHVRVLNMGTRSNCSAAVLELLPSLPVVKQVEEIWFHLDAGELVKPFQRAKGKFEHLERIIIYCFHLAPNTRARIAQSPCFVSPPEITSINPLMTKYPS